MNQQEEAVDFFESTHRYFLKKSGKELIAVSKILQISGASNFDKVPFEIRERTAFMGDCIHETARLYGLKKLEAETLDPLLVGYLESIQKFYKARVKKVLFIEKIVYDEVLGYAGTIDILYQDYKNRVCLDDFKHGEIIPAFKLQTVLYKNAFEKNYKITVDERAVVCLNGDGSFEEEKDRVIYRERRDFHDAMNILGCAYWKIENKVTT